MTREFINIDPLRSESKYRQIIHSIVAGIRGGSIKRGDKLPSIGLLCKRHNLSRDTVMSAYNELKAKGIIISLPGKGYYIDSTETHITHNIFLLFDELNAFKEELYNSFLQSLGSKGSAEVYFHHFNRKLFESLIRENVGRYTTYVVMPAMFCNITALLSTIPGKVIILDQLPEELKGTYPSVHQNFDRTVYQGLMEGRDRISRYNKFVMVYPGGKEPEGQLSGFKRFCNEVGLPYEVIDRIEGYSIRKGEAYFAIWDRDLVELVKASQEEGYVLGRDIGIISYNDAPLKEVVANGITTISTDFREMGKTLASLIINNINAQIENPSGLILRGSL